MKDALMWISHVCVAYKQHIFDTRCCPSTKEERWSYVKLDEDIKQKQDIPEESDLYVTKIALSVWYSL